MVSGLGCLDLEANTTLKARKKEAGRLHFEEERKN